MNPSQFDDRRSEGSDAHRSRRLACQFCRRIWERYPITWSDEVFANDNGNPGGYVDPAAWKNGVMRDALRVAEDYCEGRATSEQLAEVHRAVAEFAKEIDGNWSWANHRLGDSASGAEYEVGAVTSHTAFACAIASAEQVNLAECSEHAAEAIGFRWQKAERTVAVAEEKKAQDELARMAPPPC